MKATVTVAACATLLCAGMAHAAATAEQQCQAERAKAAGAYASCQQKAQARFWTSASPAPFQNWFSECRVKYAGTWAKLQGKGALAGSSCTAARFVDNGSTVTDNLTGLQWEKKTNLDGMLNFADPHDADNTYTWCTARISDGSVCENADAADGPAFTDVLRSLNSGGCFAGQCDWRLPTRDELQTILADPFTNSPCTTPACIDAIFGPTAKGGYWSATSNAGSPRAAPLFPVGGEWFVLFDFGGVGSDTKTIFAAVRTVRGGL